MKALSESRGGFTLIELSMVLVIIGLIVGGVLVGQDLIRAAGVRAQISQIEKYNTAVNTFKGKYGELPGDMDANTASQFGFAPRGTGCGSGDNNGRIESWFFVSGCSGTTQAGGEPLAFWSDLTYANGMNINMIEGNFNGPYANGEFFGNGGEFSTTNFSTYFPLAKIGRGNDVYVYSGGYWSGSAWVTNATNYFGLAILTDLTQNDWSWSTPGLTVQEAFAIDNKIDDGYPLTGNVTAAYITNVGLDWAGVAGGERIVPGRTYTAATPGSATTCFDNSNSSGATQQYSVEISNGAGVNCALSFKMQAGD